MSRIVSMTTKIRWPNADAFHRMLQKAADAMQEFYQKQTHIYRTHDFMFQVEIEGVPTITFSETPKKETAFYSYDSDRAGRNSLLYTDFLNELSLVDLREQAQRNKYRVQVNRIREEHKLAVVLERGM